MAYNRPYPNQLVVKQVFVTWVTVGFLSFPAARHPPSLVRWRCAVPIPCVADARAPSIPRWSWKVSSVIEIDWAPKKRYFTSTMSKLSVEMSICKHILCLRFVVLKTLFCHKYCFLDKDPEIHVLWYDVIPLMKAVQVLTHATGTVQLKLCWFMDLTTSTNQPTKANQLLILWKTQRWPVSHLGVLLEACKDR